MNKQRYLQSDAREMSKILRSAECLKRYDKIAHELLSELLTAIVVDGQVVGGNNRGSDINSPTHGRVEVKSRILGTDGPLPRVTLRASNVEKADNIVAVRWTTEFELFDSVLLPISSAKALYEEKKQPKGIAHIAWNDWIEHPDAVSLKVKFIEQLRSI